MRLLVIGSVVTLVSVAGLRVAFDDGPYREYCDTVSTSPDGRFQLETWEPASLDPLGRSLDPFRWGQCQHGGWLVMRETATGERIAQTESQDLWMFRQATE